MAAELIMRGEKMLKLDFTGKNVVVTGGGRGLGKACALAYADCGADVFIGNRKEDEGKSTVAEIESMGRRAAFKRTDVAVKQDVFDLIDAAKEFFGGRIDVIMHAAGVISTYDLMAAEEAEVRRLFDINIMGTSHIIQAGLEHMMPIGGGNIVTTSSIAGRTNLGMLEHYCVSKAAVISLTQAGAKKGAPFNVRVNSVAPGIIRTRMWEEILDGMATGFHGSEGGRNAASEEEREANWNNSVKGLIPLGRAQQPEDIAWGALFLSSDLAREITGQVLHVDGGCCMV